MTSNVPERHLTGVREKDPPVSGSTDEERKMCRRGAVKEQVFTGNGVCSDGRGSAGVGSDGILIV